jgi:drug/metabolite transporter (DMT)-like permease
MAWLGLALGWAGVAVLGAARLAGHVGMAEGMTEALGVCLALLGAISQAAGLLLARSLRRR